MPRGVRLDLTGQRFGRLVVIERAGSIPLNNPGSTMVLWRVRCECGTEKTVRANSLRESVSCGCAIAERNKRLFTTHGATRNYADTPEYVSWKAMRLRCSNPNNSGFALYGGRGIYVCQRWRESFADFLADMGTKPSARHSIDRVDPERSYTCGRCEDCVSRGAPANCRWSDPRTQQRNRRDNLVLTIDGVTRTAREWAEVKGVSFVLLRSRIRHGWPIEDLFLPVYACRHYRASAA